MLTYLWGLTALVLLMPALAYSEGFLFRWQKRDEQYDNVKVAVLITHGGIWSDLVFLNPIVAHLLGAYGSTWSLNIFAIYFVVAIFVGVPLVRQWTEDSNEVPEALARDGLLTIAGSVHYLYMTLVLAVIGLYIAEAKAPLQELVLVALALSGHVLLGTLQPPWASRGYVPKSAIVVAIVGCFAVALIATLKFYLL